MTTTLERDPPPEPRRCALESCGKELEPGQIWMDSRGELFCSALCGLRARGIVKP